MRNEVEQVLPKEIHRTLLLIRFTLHLYSARYQSGSERQHQSLSNFGFVTRYRWRSNVDNSNVHTLLLYLCSAKPVKPAYLSHRRPVWSAFDLGTGYGLSWMEEKSLAVESPGVS